MGSLATEEPLAEHISSVESCGYEDIKLASKDPMDTFKAWLEEARRHPALNPMPEALTLCTVREDGGPSSRTVLLRGMSDDGFKMYWDKRSRKTNEVNVDARTALVFRWHLKRSDGTMESRQVRVEGIIEELTEEENTAYFNSEPLIAKIRATVCHQSRVVRDDRVAMVKEINRLWKAAHDTQDEAGMKMTKPDYWGGYLLRPRMIEFYQGKRDTINDRIRFRKVDQSSVKLELDEGVSLGQNGWAYERLEP